MKVKNVFLIVGFLIFAMGFRFINVYKDTFAAIVCVGLFFLCVFIGLSLEHIKQFKDGEGDL